MAPARRALRRRFPLTRDNLHGVLRAINVHGMVPHLSLEVHDVLRHFQCDGHAPGRDHRRAIIAALDDLAPAGHVKWWRSPTEVARGAAAEQVWRLFQPDLLELWRSHVPDQTDKERDRMVGVLWWPDAEATVEGMQTTRDEAPGHWLRIELPDSMDDYDRLDEISKYVTEIDSDAVYLAVEHLEKGHGVGFDELENFFGIRTMPVVWEAVHDDGSSEHLANPPLNEFAQLLKDWSKDHVLHEEGASGKERYRLNPHPPAGNAMSMFMELWPWSRHETHRPYGPTEAGEKTRLKKATVSEHFAKLVAVGLLEGAGKDYRPCGLHPAPWVARILAEIEVRQRGGPDAVVTVEALLHRLAEDVAGEPFHKMTADARQGAITGALRAGLIGTSTNRARPPPTAAISVTPAGWFALRACHSCARPIAEGDAVTLETGGQADKWRWKTMRHADCKVAAGRTWEGHRYGDMYDGEHLRDSRSCLGCDRGLWQVTGRDLLHAHPTGGDAALVALRRLKALLPRTRAATTARSDGASILRQLEDPGLTVPQRERLLQDLLAYLEEMDIVAPAPRKEWWATIAEFERRYHRNDTDLFRVFRIRDDEPGHALDHEIRHVLREDAPAAGILHHRGFHHPTCAPSGGEG